MTPESYEEMKGACHALAEHILRQNTRTNRSGWLKKRLAEQLTDGYWIDVFAEEYDDEYAYADVPTEFLAKTLQAFDKGEE